MADVKLAWVADANERRGRDVAKQNATSFVSTSAGPTSLPACEVMLFAIPLPPRQPYFDHCARTGTAVMAEKPLANTAAEHAALVSAFPSWKLAVGFQRRHHATSLLLKRLIEGRICGALRRIRVGEGGRVVRTGGSGSYQDAPTSVGGGIVKNLGCHSLDLVLWLTAARGYRVRQRSLEWDAATDRRAHAIVQLDDVLGQRGYECELDWTVSWLDPQPNTYEFEFEGGVLTCPVAPAGALSLLGQRNAALGEVRAEPGAGAVTSAQAFYLHWRDFLRALETESDPVSSAVSCHMSAELIDELCKPAEASEP